MSTGRCGTQSLATHLRDVYRDAAIVTHEPIGPEYRCREFFRAYDRVDDMAEVPAIRRHLDDVAAVLRHRSYVETGWPLFSAVPLFIERFGSRVRLVHLTRHPVPTAISHMVHKTYGGSPRRDGYTQLAALDAHCPGVFQRELADRWEQLEPFEKTLFWWTEVHLYAEELAQRYPEVPLLRVKAEDVLRPDDDALRALAEFLGVPFRDELRQRMTRPVDQWRHRTETAFDWRRALDHDAALQVARRLGYRIDDVDDDALAQRYAR